MQMPKTQRNQNNNILHDNLGIQKEVSVEFQANNKIE